MTGNETQMNMQNGKWFPSQWLPNNLASIKPWKNEWKSWKTGQGANDESSYSHIPGTSSAWSSIINGFVRYIDKLDEIRIELAISDLSQKNFDITVLGNELRIEILSDSGETEQRPAFMIPLPLSVDISKISSKYKEDILTITAPRSLEMTKSIKKIKVA